jgi:lipopolysaccharide/colanic/teichoic acid biosynthesis glycosyltransferase
MMATEFVSTAAVDTAGLAGSGHPKVAYGEAPLTSATYVPLDECTPSAVDGLESLAPHGFAFRTARSRAIARRIFDFSVALFAIIASSPVLAFVALLIKLEDGGPVFFAQRRVGRFGKLFVMYKLRTMKIGACGDALKPSMPADARITTVGRYLRKLSIDELPQFFNVLRGDMALVGPRPEMPFIVRSYHPWQQLRHLVLPGITGLWQVTSRKTIPMQHPKATALDIEYIRRRSLATDISMLFKTVLSLIRTTGVH